MQKKEAGMTCRKRGRDGMQKKVGMTNKKKVGMKLKDPGKIRGNICIAKGRDDRKSRATTSWSP
jgi:hypothetical protein